MLKLRDALATNPPKYAPCGFHDDETKVVYMFSDWGPTEIICASCGDELFKFMGNGTKEHPLHWEEVLSMQELEESRSA